MSYGSKPKSAGGGRSTGTRAHLGEKQECHQDRQFNARLEADKERLAELEGKRTREAAERAKLRLKVKSEDERRAQKDRVKRIDLAFNVLPDGSEVSHQQMSAIIAGAANVDHYWKDCGGKRAGEFKAVPLGGSVDARGQGNDPTRYLAINSRPWHTWGLLDATEAGLPGKAFLKHAVHLFAPIFERMTGLRALVWPLHKKPNNIHPQPMMCCISAPCTRPGKQPKNARKQGKVAGLLLTHPDRRGRGRSPLDWVLVGETVCSLEHLRLAGFDLIALTGDPDILTKLKSWIAYAEKNGNKALDLEAEKELDKCIVATVEAFPGFRPFFAHAWERFKAQKDKEAAAIIAEIARDAREFEAAHSKDHSVRFEQEKDAPIASGQREIDAAVAAGEQHDRSADGARPEAEKTQTATRGSWTAVPSERIDAPFLTRLAAVQKRLLERELPSAEEIALLTPKANAVAEFSIRPDLFLAVFELLNDRELRLLAEEVVDLQQAMSAPMRATQVYKFAEAAVLRRLKGEPARRGDERYFTPEFVAEAKSRPDAAYDFLESLAFLERTLTDEQPWQMKVEPQVPGQQAPAPEQRPGLLARPILTSQTQHELRSTGREFPAMWRRAN